MAASGLVPQVRLSQEHRTNESVSTLLFIRILLSARVDLKNSCSQRSENLRRLRLMISCRNNGGWTFATLTKSSFPIEEFIYFPKHHCSLHRSIIQSTSYQQIAISNKCTYKLKLKMSAQARTYHLQKVFCTCNTIQQDYIERHAGCIADLWSIMYMHAFHPCILFVDRNLDTCLYLADIILDLIDGQMKTIVPVLADQS